MQLCATLTKEDLTTVIETITPLRVAVGRGRGVLLGRPTKVELVEGAGLRVRGDARFTWDVGAITLPVHVRAWQMLLVPRFAARATGHVLELEPRLEALDFKRVPMFLDGRISGALKDALENQRAKLGWDFAKHLSVARAFPPSITPETCMSLGPTHGNVTITSTEVRLTFTFAMRIDREAASFGAPADLDVAPPSSHVAAR